MKFISQRRLKKQTLSDRSLKNASLHISTLQSESELRLGNVAERQKKNKTKKKQ